MAKKTVTKQLVKVSTSKQSKPLEFPQIEQLYQRISGYIDEAKRAVQHSVDTEMVKAYWLIGREIVQEEQQGKKRAQYGSFLLSELSINLTVNAGKK